MVRLTDMQNGTKCTTPTTKAPEHHMWSWELWVPESVRSGEDAYMNVVIRNKWRCRNCQPQAASCASGEY